MNYSKHIMTITGLVVIAFVTGLVVIAAIVGDAIVTAQHQNTPDLIIEKNVEPDVTVVTKPKPLPKPVEETIVEPVSIEEEPVIDDRCTQILNAENGISFLYAESVKGPLKANEISNLHLQRTLSIDAVNKQFGTNIDRLFFSGKNSVYQDCINVTSHDG